MLKVGGIHEASLPTGQTSVDYIKPFLVDTSTEEGIKECVTQCCQLGSSRCQYVWLFTSKCFAIGCTAENADKCRPMRMPALSSSAYVAVEYRPGLEADNGG